MKKYILDYLCNLEGKKTAIKQLHWDSKNLSQHKLCDDIAEALSEFQDKVGEVEQSISGRLPINMLKGTPYKVSTLKQLMNDIISDANAFYSKLKNEGDEYIGMRSDVEAFLSDSQRLSYLVDFTIKEALKERLRNKINENRVTISDGKTSYSLTENELREVVNEAINNIKEASDFSMFNNSEFIKFGNKLKDLRKVCEHMVYFANAKGEQRFIAFIGSLVRNIDRFNEFIDEEYGNGLTNENKNGIHIKPENKGKFTATKKATGKSTEELTHSKNPLTRKRANFAKMAKRGWKPLSKKES